MKTHKLRAYYVPALKNIRAWQEGQAGGLKWKAPLFSRQEMKSLCLHLKENARDELYSLNSETIAQELGQLSRLWQNKNYHYRKKAEDIIAAVSGCSSKNIREGLNLAFKEVSARKILSSMPLIRQLPQGGLTFCVFAGIISTPMLFDIFLSLLRKSAVLAKSPSREPFFPILLAESLHEFSPVLGKCLASLWWPGGQTPIEKEIFSQADFINAYGDDSTVFKMSSYANGRKNFIPLGHKVSLSFLGKRSFSHSLVRNLTKKIAYDVFLYDQQGCLSPHAIYIEKPSGFKMRCFLRELAEAMQNIGNKLPMGKLSFAEASRIHQTRGQYQFRKNVICLTSPSKTDWTLIYEKDESFHPSCLNRVLFIKEIRNIGNLGKILENWTGKIQGLAYETSKAEENKVYRLARHLKIPVCRPVGQIQQLRFHDHIQERLHLWHGKKP